MSTYSFEDVVAAIVGPGGFNFSLSGVVGMADEAITVEMDEDKVSTVWGADGSWMHSLHASSGGRVSVRLLKTSIANHALSVAYNYQQLSSAYAGQNTISIKNPVSQDSILCEGCAFTRLPTNANAKDGGTMDWVFRSGKITQHLGTFPAP